MFSSVPTNWNDPTIFLMKPLLTLFLYSVFLASSFGFEQAHSELDQILGTHVDSGLVDYEAIHESPEQLNQYLASVAKVTTQEFEQWSRDEQLAFLINVYNAATLHLIVAHYPTSSIKQIPDQWDLEHIALFGGMVSLNNVEHELIRARFDDARAHYALVCAALSCPPLRAEAYVASKLDAQLDDQGTIFFSQANKNFVSDDGTLHLSPILNWFTEDFVDSESELASYAKKWLPKEAASKIDPEKPVQFTFYDWGLNQKGAVTAETAPSGIQAKILTGLQFIDNLGTIKAVVYGLAYIGLSLAFVSAGMLTIAGGFFFGPVWGTVIVSLVSTTAAALAFLISRYLARGFIEKRIEGNEKFAAVDRAVGREGWKIVGLTRLSPLFPFVFLNYAYGLTKVKFPHYVLASWLTMLPGTIVYVWIGSLAKNLTTIAAGGGAGSTPKLILSIIGIAATFAVTAYVTKLARKALNEKVGADEVREDGGDSVPSPS